MKKCYRNVSSDVYYALKILNKERISNFTGLKRMSNEIGTLRQLKSSYIVSLYDVIQTKNKLYIVTELGGSDLFEFFDEHPGLPLFLFLSLYIYIYIVLLDDVAHPCEIPPTVMTCVL